jgi:hypothetical protein
MHDRKKNRPTRKYVDQLGMHIPPCCMLTKNSKLTHISRNVMTLAPCAYMEALVARFVASVRQAWQLKHEQSMIMPQRLWWMNYFSGRKFWYKARYYLGAMWRGKLEPDVLRRRIYKRLLLHNMSCGFIFQCIRWSRELRSRSSCFDFYCWNEQIIFSFLTPHELYFVWRHLFKFWRLIMKAVSVSIPPLI